MQKCSDSNCNEYAHSSKPQVPFKGMDCLGGPQKCDAVELNSWSKNLCLQMSPHGASYTNWLQTEVRRLQGIFKQPCSVAFVTFLPPPKKVCVEKCPVQKGANGEICLRTYAPFCLPSKMDESSSRGGGWQMKSLSISQGVGWWLYFIRCVVPYSRDQ